MQFRPAVLLPTYNNASTLRHVIALTLKLGHPVYVIDDGSTDATAEILADLTSTKQFEHQIEVLKHSVNLGKAEALRTGFRAARGAGLTHAFTLDTDGQLSAADIPALIAAAESAPDALVLGARDDRAADYPAASRIGRRLSNFAIRLECGAKVLDSQCGLRAYPLRMFEFVNARASRYGFETEVITRFAWAGGEIVNVPVSCRYFTGDEHVSHFKRWPETFRALALHARLLLRALWPAPHLQPLKTKHVHSSQRGLWHELGSWINPRNLWRQLRSDGAGRGNIAAGFAMGVFIANLPLYGLQTLLGLYIARRWHLHAIPIVAGTQLSIPPIAPFLIIGAIYVGHVVLFGGPPSVSELQLTPGGLARAGVEILAAWLVGGIALGVAMGAAAFIIIYSALAPFSPKPPPCERNATDRPNDPDKTTTSDRAERE